MRIEEELRTYLQVLWRYKWIISACAIISLMVALGISFQLTPLYSATTTLRVASAPGGTTDYISMSSLTQLRNTYVEIASSDISLDEVEKRLGLQEQPKVQVDVVPETELIRITGSDPDPARARDIANTLAGMMVEQSVQLYGGSGPTSREILEEQLKQARVDLDTALEEYESVLRGTQSPVTLPANGTPIPNPNEEMLARLLSVRQQIFTDLLQKYEAARTSEQLRANAITVVETAYLPQNPATPRVPLNGALGLLGGFAGGLILAFFFESIDDTLRGIEDVHAITTLPILCTIPELKRFLGRDANLNFSRNGHYSLTPSIHQLRARLILSDGKPKSTTFLITSPEPSAGKSTIAANLAVSLAKGGNRVVLIDMDFRRSRLHTILGLPNGKGFSDFVRGEIQLDAILHATTHSDLRVVTSGSYQHVPDEWLTPVKIGSLLETMSKECDYVLIDAPALLSVADPTVLASQADAVILVVARRKTERQHLHFALQQLAEIKAKVAGIVINRVPNAELYSYYSEQHYKQTKHQRGKTKKQIAVEYRSKHSKLDEE